MTIKKKYSGVVIPAVTPITATYQLDEGAVEAMFGNFYKHNVSPFILGTTGESASLSNHVKTDYLQAASKFKKEGSMLYAGISSNCFEESVDFAKQCLDHGVDAVAATLPSYYALNESQMQRYFELLADAIPVPLIIYNIPATTHMSIPLAIIDTLSHHENIVGTKDSERSDERLQQSIALWKDRQDFSHFLGWAARSARAMIDGSDGLIPSTGNLVPGIYNDMKKAVEAGDEEKAFQLQHASDVFGNLYQGGRTLGESLWALKLLMREAVLCQPFVMPPLQSGSDEEATKLAADLRNLLVNEGVAL
ncbi:MAG: dihydrodipicolinate synthase family protein [Bacteroidota bacterium]